MYFSKFFEVPQKVLKTSLKQCDYQVKECISQNSLRYLKKVLKTSLGEYFDFDSALDTIQSVPLT